MLANDRLKGKGTGALTWAFSASNLTESGLFFTW
jgi:hypothetical protein